MTNQSRPLSASKCVLSCTLATLMLFSAVPPTTLAAPQAEPAMNLSPAVVNTTSQAIVALYAQIKNGTVKPGDFQSTAIALKILFAYLQEQGFNAKLDAAIRQNPDLSNAPVSAIAQDVYAQLRAIGVSGVSVKQIEGSLNVSPEAVTRLAVQGSQQIEAQLINGLVALSSESNATNAKFINHQRVRLLMVMSVTDCQAVKNDAEAASGLALEAAILGAEPVALAFAAVAAAYLAEYYGGGCQNN